MIPTVRCGVRPTARFPSSSISTEGRKSRYAWRPSPGPRRHPAHKLRDQETVLDQLQRDVANHQERGEPTPDAILVTGDTAWSGAAAQYEIASRWLDRAAASLGVSAERVFLVPGNHDLDRSVDTNRNVARLVRSLREGDDLLDDVLGDMADKKLLASRLGPYLSFILRFPSIQYPDPLAWVHTLVVRGLPVRIVGLATSLLSAAGDVDHGRLWLGRETLARTFENANRTNEFVVVLSHHPLEGGWLADQRDADRWVQDRAHVHLFGHMHETEPVLVVPSRGVGVLRVGAVSSRPPVVHGYNIGAVIAAGEGALRVRVWPRRWSRRERAFTIGIRSLPEGRPYVEHRLSGLGPLGNPLTSLQVQSGSAPSPTDSS